MGLHMLIYVEAAAIDIQGIVLNLHVSIYDQVVSVLVMSTLYMCYVYSVAIEALIHDNSMMIRENTQT